MLHLSLLLTAISLVSGQQQQPFQQQQQQQPFQPQQPQQQPFQPPQQQQPQPQPQPQQDCALLVHTPPNEQRTCIPFSAVNTAFEVAKQASDIAPPDPEFTVDDAGKLAVVIEETSRILAQQFGLSPDGVANGLPLIDTSRTEIANFCPPSLLTPDCPDPERYRTPSGICNNLAKPHQGAAQHGHDRFVTPDYSDGISAPRASVTGNALPSARLISTNAHVGDDVHDHAVTMMLVAWGQFTDHDITLSAEPTEDITRKTPKCCEGSNSIYCFPIEIPQGDSFFAQFGQSCMNFVRSSAGLRDNCRLGPRMSFNLVSSLLDASTTYGSDKDTADSLREFTGGKLKMLPLFDRNMMQLLPLNLNDPNAGCIRPSGDVFCFLSGDSRVNEQTILAMVHTLMAREHNRIVTELARVNPKWSDETLYQEARHIVAAMEQHITYNEFLPMVLGRDVMQANSLILKRDGYFDGYDPTVNPSANTAFTAAAFRFGHSLLPNQIQRWSKTHRFIGAQDLSGMLLQPYDLYKEGWADQYVMGMVNQVAQKLDNWVSPEIQNHLFQEPGKPFGMDLSALNIQRARELGVPSYTIFREWCGLPPLNGFGDLVGIFPNNTLNAYASLYASVDDIDMWSAGISELTLPGAMVGPTLACVISRQFHNFRFGDRFWYENGGFPSSFTPEQLRELRKVRLSRIICDNGDDIDSVQVFAMVLPDPKINPRVACGSGVLKGIDFGKWKDASQPLQQQQQQIG